jgi:hypothetical protein
MDFTDRIVLYSPSRKSLSSNEVGWINPKVQRMGDQRVPASSGARGPAGEAGHRSSGRRVIVLPGKATLRFFEREASLRPLLGMPEVILGLLSKPTFRRRIKCNG